ncbi:hypothetical protein D3C75_864500 [compost metagenome]
MKYSRRSFLRILGIGAGAAVAAPVMAMIPEPKVDLAALEEAFHRQVEEDLLKRLREGVYESLENSNYKSAIASMHRRQDEFATAFYPTTVIYP